ncbi:hypothetical protein [Brucella pseudogrignonensis]|uniref:hypothetical protein n=1 Tax=Brucella pseudogrignonensis TaxID=419475 RepID=UPI003ECF1ED0
MAKQPKTNTNAPKVPDAEPVGDPALFNTDQNAVQGDPDAQTGNPPLSADAEATGVAAPVATSSTDTTASSGAAAGTTSVELVKPQESAELTEVTTTDEDQGASSPEPEAAGSGNTSEGGLSEAAVQSILSKVLGVDSGPEKRRFILLRGPVRHNNVRYERGKLIILTETEHAELHSKQRVSEWDHGEELD